MVVFQNALFLLDLYFLVFQLQSHFLYFVLVTIVLELHFESLNLLFLLGYLGILFEKSLIGFSAVLLGLGELGVHGLVALGLQSGLLEVLMALLLVLAVLLLQLSHVVQ